MPVNTCILMPHSLRADECRYLHDRLLEVCLVTRRRACKDDWRTCDVSRPQERLEWLVDPETKWAIGQAWTARNLAGDFYYSFWPNVLSVELLTKFRWFCEDRINRDKVRYPARSLARLIGTPAAVYLPDTLVACAGDKIEDESASWDELMEWLRGECGAPGTARDLAAAGEGAIERTWFLDDFDELPVCPPDVEGDRP